VKIGTWPCLYLAEEQIDKYVTLADGNAAFKQQLGVDRVEHMPTSRLTLTQLRDPVSGTPIDVGWCSPGIIVYKAVPEQEEPEEEPEQEPPEQEPQQQGPDTSSPLRDLLKELGAEMAKLLATDYLLSAALSFVSSFVALAPFMLLAGLAFGIVYFWDEIKSVAQWIGGAIPLTYFLRILRGILLRGTGIEAIWKDVLTLCVFALVLMTLSATRFRKSLD